MQFQPLEEEQTMEGRHSYCHAVGDFIHKHFLVLLLTAYAVAAVFPTFGLWLRNVSLGEYDLLQEDTKITLPMLMLALLLLNAGLGVRISELRNLVRSPAP